MSDSNPYGMGNPYSTTVQYGGPDAASAPASADPIKDTTTSAFAADVIQESRRQPVLVDFWAPWCGPCKQLTPVLEKAVRAAGGRVKLVKMNIDEHPAIAGQLGIQSIPAVIAFRDGQPVDGFMGALPESQVNQFIQKLGGKNSQDLQIEDAMAAAAEAREAGDLQGAADIYSMVLERAPETVEASVGLAEILVEAGDAEAAEAVLAAVPEAKQATPAVTALRTRMKLQAEAAGLGDPAELQRRLAADPKDHQARFDLAMIQNALGDRTAAADGLLAIIKADRAWKDDGAKAQLLKFFEAWGMMDEATLAARRKLSSVLFS